MAAYAAPHVLAEKDDKDKASIHNDRLFDPEALERGAKALREINKSPYAKQALELSRQQEVTKQAEHREKEADYRRQAAALEKEREVVRYEEERKMEEQRAQVAARMKQYEDELARKRMMAEHELQRQRNAELAKLQEEASARAEQERLRVEQQIQAERRAAEQYAADLQKQIQRERALAEAEGRIKEARENEDVNRRAALLKYQEETRKALESIHAVMSHLGAAALELVTDTNKLLTAVGGTTLLFLGVYATRETTRVVGKTVEAWLGTPRLVRETSRFSLWSPKSWSLGPSRTKEDIKKDFSDIILHQELHDTVRQVAAAAANTKAHGAPFRHMLFYGPPGTGETMVAKRMARTSGLDYAIMSGGDVAPLEGRAVTQLHQTFDWAEKSRRGLLLFIDEADAFLGRRSDSMSEGLRGSLNALLFRTGDQSRDFMVVLATNRPGDLDDAVLDRMDEALEFGLPGLAERQRLLGLYLDKYIAKAGTAEGGAGAGSAGGPLARLTAMIKGRKGITEELLAETARATEGFSGRELAKLLAAVQAAVYGAPQPVLTPEIWRTVLARKLHEHAERRSFRLGHHGTGDSAPVLAGPGAGPQ
ncbi:hypothetical protein VOLCADRAFT_64976 [Volvox carteri f. nagariensis]|uniref:AAA+ ATPase domain-containing protein n=1 Tax=Volvox carteri f. nagariensis TaxID=3068 RepID=D8U7P9_VOLCA|nr:uncharacterized protein VOLCADRAFT_64976 [Volvox carteri f. nagariensis]EFJ44341.1 hypothetical protein VOLCADRAFT_64976 [Volvox carteri f. nagariensis]|eukprot:XP_002954700.1 hypothetical protein VOLCADRAFT_64976 [Volvox carteri f. nagariensis]